MRLFKKKDSGINIVNTNDVLRSVSFINSDKMNELICDVAKQFGKEHCLDIGTGHDDAEYYTTVDMDIACKPNIVGDIRCLFAASDYYREMLPDYPDLKNLKSRSFYYIRLKHVVEHIEWIYQQSLFEWLSNIIASGGCIEIETPNWRYIAKMYSEQIGIQDSGGAPKFPAGELNGLDVTNPIDFQRWIQFKVFSGCSPGDTHHACFDVYSLCYYLQHNNFTDIRVYNGSSLRVFAIRKSDSGMGLDAMIDEYLGV